MQCTGRMERSQEKTKRTAIYGGSFNPIHTGHTQLARWITEQGYADELWFLVSPLNPLKQEASSTLLPDDVRLHLAQLAIEEDAENQPTRMPGLLCVSDFEMHLPRPSYMVNTLKELRRTYPDHDFLLLIGADNWLCFDQWYQPENILAHHRILVYPRKGYPIDPSSLPSCVTLLDSAPLFPTSSTLIRQAIQQGTCQGEWLATSVWQEIRQEGYYANIHEAKG